MIMDDIKCENYSLSRRVTSMLRCDFQRLFRTPLLYILTAVSFVLPILILVMTSMVGGNSSSMSFTNVWQVIASSSSSSSSMMSLASSSGASSATSSMDMSSMMNMNMIFFLIAVLVCVFIGEDFRSGYAKLLFTNRSRKNDYVISKTIALFLGSALMLIFYFVGAMVGGKIAGLSFDLADCNAFNVICCVLGKVFLSLMFVSIYIIASVFSKNKVWLSILLSLGVGMLFFMIIPMVTPLDSSIVNAMMSLAGGFLFSIGFGVVSTLILSKTRII